jgi:hypothetical protein
VLVLGDSHSKVFHYINHITESRHFDACSISAISALGLANINSSTHGLAVFRDKLAQAETTQPAHTAVLIMLGEVDTGFGIWRRSRKYNTTAEEQIQLVVATLFVFIAEVRERYPMLPIGVAGG